MPVAELARTLSAAFATRAVALLIVVPAFLGACASIDEARVGPIQLRGQQGTLLAAPSLSSNGQQPFSLFMDGSWSVLRPDGSQQAITGQVTVQGLATSTIDLPPSGWEIASAVIGRNSLIWEVDGRRLPTGVSAGGEFVVDPGPMRFTNYAQGVLAKGMSIPELSAGAGSVRVKAVQFCTTSTRCSVLQEHVVSQGPVEVAFNVDRSELRIRNAQFVLDADAATSMATNVVSSVLGRNVSATARSGTLHFSDRLSALELGDVTAEFADDAYRSFLTVHRVRVEGRVVADRFASANVRLAGLTVRQIPLNLPARSGLARPTSPEQIPLNLPARSGLARPTSPDWLAFSAWVSKADLEAQVATAFDPAARRNLSYVAVDPHDANVIVNGVLATPAMWSVRPATFGIRAVMAVSERNQDIVLSPQGTVLLHLEPSTESSLHISIDELEWLHGVTSKLTTQLASSRVRVLPWAFRLSSGPEPTEQRPYTQPISRPSHGLEFRYDRAQADRGGIRLDGAFREAR